MPEPKITGPATDTDPSNRYCTHCKKPLNGTVAWLELDQRDNTYHDRQDVPPEKSQGWFPFGVACARKVNRR